MRDMEDLNNMETEQNSALEPENGETDSPLAREDAGSNAEAPVEEGTVPASEYEKIKRALESKENEYRDLLDKTQRIAAEYDNYRKRTLKEKERLYSDSACEIVAKFLPAVDNLERALKAAETDAGQGFREGVALVFRQLADILDKLDVKTIESVGKTFDPSLHHAVMHVEDEDHGAGEIIEEFQKGYTFGDDTVIRHAMVKVAN